MNNTYLWEGLPVTALAMRTFMERMEPAAIDRPTHTDRFSPREVVAHMADWEPRLLDRMKTAASSPGSRVEAYDEGELAVQNAYDKSDWRDQLNLFEKSRLETIAFLKGLTNEHFDKKFVHPERGDVTIEDQAAMMLGHDLYHLDQLSEVLERSGLCAA